jgi:pSer/pThr/pTyr-binding forkhead associated (FHA) protein
MERIDVYHQWLGIPPQHQPPSLYRLLGIADFESDAGVIRSAAERQTMHVRRLSRGRFIDAGQELLNEIAYAKLNLIDPGKRSAYDEVLRQSVDQESSSSESSSSESSDLPTSNDVNQTLPSGEVDSSEHGATLADAPGRDGAIADEANSPLIWPSSVKATRVDASLLSPQSPGPWLLGYHADCDVMIDHRTVSGMHCRISHAGDQWKIVDLHSTNGTFVNGQRVTKKVLGPNDLIVLGGDHRVILPADWFRDFANHPKVAFVGRANGNELQIDSKLVSRFHARLIQTGESIVVEDLNSGHGTWVVDAEGQESRIARQVVRSPQHVRFADTSVPVKQLAELMSKL